MMIVTFNNGAKRDDVKVDGVPLLEWLASKFGKPENPKFNEVDSTVLVIETPLALSSELDNLFWGQR